MRWISKHLAWFQFRTYFKFLSGNLIYQIVTICADIWLLRFVEVKQIGFWQYGLLLQSYVIISRLGVINAFNRDYPYLIASNRVEDAKVIAQTVAFHVSLSKYFQAAFFMVNVAYQYLTGGEYYLVITLLIMTGYTVLDASLNFEEAKLRAALDFNKISLVRLIAAIVSLLLLVLPYYFLYEGLLARAIFIQLLHYIFFRLISKTSVPSKFSLEYWLILFREGWKIWLCSYINSINKISPKMYIATFCGLEALGLFAPINWMILGFTLFTSSLSEYLYPNLTQRFAKGDDKLPKQSLIINTFAFAVSIPVVILGYLFIPELVTRFLPNYSSVVSPMQIALVASTFDIFSTTTTVWIAMRDWKRAWVSVLSNSAIRAGSLMYLYIYNLKNLTNISVTILMVSLINSLINVAMVYHKDAESKKKTPVLLV